MATSRLEELVICLTTAIIRYHDFQRHVSRKVIVDPKKVIYPLPEAVKILQCSEVAYDKILKILIDETTTNDYTERKPFLDFLLHEIKYLKTFLDRRSALTKDELDDYIKQISHLFSDLNQLLYVGKTSTYPMRHSGNGVTISLIGLKEESHIFNSFCYSGNCIDEALKRFNIAKTTSLQEIETTAQNICAEQQTALLEKELRVQLNEALIANESLQSRLAGLKTENKDLQEKLQQTGPTFETLRTTIASLQASLSVDEGIKSDLRAKLEAAEQNIGTLETTISTLQEKVRELNLLQSPRGIGFGSSFFYPHRASPFALPTGVTTPGIGFGTTDEN